MKKSNKKILLLTGVSGFLGSHMLKKLVFENEYEIICLKRSFSNMKRLNEINIKDVKFYDIDKVDLEKVFEDNCISIILHMATEYGRENVSSSQILETNLIYPLKIAELGIKYNVKCFINTDSYFNKESFSYNYLLNYSLSKKSLLSWLKVLSDRMSIINVILEHIYGENDNESKFVEYAIRTIAIEEKTDINLTHGHQRRDFIYIDDVVNALYIILDYALNRSFKYKIFEVGTGKAFEIRELIEIVKKISNSKTYLNYGKIPYRKDEIMESKANIKELVNLGYEVKYTLENGLSKIIEIYKNEK